MLALVLETDGSTYAGAGDMVLFCNGGQVGWLSGGCLEPELARRAEQVSAAGRVDWIEIDTRSDDDLLSGSALGCRAGCGLRSCHCVPWQASTTSSRLGCAKVCHSSATFVRRARSYSAPAIASRRGSCIRWRGAAFGEGAWHLPLPRLPRVLVLGAVPKRPSWFRCCGAWGGGSAWPNGERAGPQPGSAQMRIFRPARPRPFMATHATRYW